MKLSLNVEADSINVLALNMGRIAVDIDGIELTELIDVVCGNGCLLRIADTPGKLVVETPLLPSVRLSGLCCSTAHITRQDNIILEQVSLQCNKDSHNAWIHDTGYGYLLRLNARRYPVLELKRMGLSAACRRLVASLMQRYPVDILHLDAAGDLLPGFEAFGW